MYSIPMRYELPIVVEPLTSSNILCFNWNTDNLHLCGQYNVEALENNICYNPLFFQTIYENIILYDPMICVFVTEGDPENRTYFHSTFLPENMLNYRLIANDKFYNPEGTIRMSIYIKYNDITTRAIELNPGWLFNDNQYECPLITEYNPPKALGLYLKTVFGNIAFIGVQMTHGFPSKETCLNRMEDKFIVNKDLDFVFLMGDFANNHVVSKEDSTNFLLMHKLQTSTIPLSYVEGYVSPQSYPNYNKNSNTVSWHDRIFYKAIDQNGPNSISCLLYQTVNNYPMKLSRSKHLGILGVFEITPNDSNQEKLIFTKSYGVIGNRK